ncbi:hypothetical protein LF817_19155 [Halobacillus sp. A1]|uniref:hypothetical protein n=1 Tax=Halobacillus sp. A1 TaxID=2880262 RepID=UPI0020A641FE|nr:hypothetical protein [Halobacillus sp. A1]MCP3033447.1 hypothetical protein [Halobacillus sp. A1]
MNEKDINLLLEKFHKLSNDKKRMIFPALIGCLEGEVLMSEETTREVIEVLKLIFNELEVARFDIPMQ